MRATTKIAAGDGSAVSARRKTSPALIFALFAPFFFPSGFEYGNAYDAIASVLKLWQIIAVTVLGIITLVQILKHKLPYGIAAFGIAVAAITYSTLAHGFSIMNVATTWGAYLVFALGTYVYGKRDPQTFIFTLRNWLVFISAANLISMLIYPNGLPNTWLSAYAESAIEPQRIWLWGFKNSLASLLLPMLAFVTLGDKLRGKNFSVWQLAAYILLTVTALLSSSSTLIFVAVLLLLVQFVFKYLRLSFLLNARAAFAMWLIAEILVVVFHVQERFSSFIHSAFGKDATLSARTLIWDLAAPYIAKSPIIGWGLQGDDFILLRYNRAFSHTHNALLMILFTGGVIALGFFLIYVWAASTPLYRHRQDIHACAISVLLAGYYVIALTGSFLSLSVMAILSVAMIYDSIDSAAKETAQTSQQSQTHPDDQNRRKGIS